MRTQVGGGLAIFIGVLLFLSVPSVPQGSVPDLHQMAKLFIWIGAFLLVAGTMARAFSIE